MREATASTAVAEACAASSIAGISSGPTFRAKFPSTVRWTAAPAINAAKATKQIFRLARLSRRVRRIYFYNWAPSTRPRPTWDSALTDKRGKPRPAYRVLKAWLERHR